MKKMFTGLVLSTLFLALPGLAQASSACFDWDCDETTHICDFDASCSTFGGGQIWRYRWDFGDGSGLTFTGSPNISHSYSVAYPEVTLTLIMLSGTDDDETCEIVVYNAVGPAQGTEGRCQ